MMMRNEEEPGSDLVWSSKEGRVDYVLLKMEYL